MKFDEPVGRGPALIDALAREDLGPLSMGELEARVVTLETEIARTRRTIDQVVHHRATADALFRS